MWLKQNLPSVDKYDLYVYVPQERPPIPFRSVYLWKSGPGIIDLDIGGRMQEQINAGRAVLSID